MRPPQHRIDAPILFVHYGDPAIDWDRVNEEIENLDEDETRQHPFICYYRGQNRYDLDAEYDFGGKSVTPRDYLGDGAVIWRLRSLDHEEWPAIEAQVRKAYRDGVDPLVAYKDAAKMCTIGVDGADFKVERIGNSLTRETCRRMFDLRQDLMVEIGAAVYMASRPIGDDEKKQ